MRNISLPRCQANVTDVLNEECFARTSCELPVADNRLFRTAPCGEMRNYLETSHTCVPGNNLAFVRRYIVKLDAISELDISPPYVQ